MSCTAFLYIFYISNRQLAAQHEQICCVKSCELDEKRATKPKLVAQSRPALYFSQQLLQPATNVSWSHGVKNGNYQYRIKLATKQCWGFLYVVFRCLKFMRNTFEFWNNQLSFLPSLTRHSVTRPSVCELVSVSNQQRKKNTRFSGQNPKRRLISVGYL